MSRCSNRLRWATTGDAGDNRRLRLTGANDLTEASSIAGWIWKTGTARTGITVEAFDAQHVDVDFGTWLATAPAPDDWWFEIEVDGVTWPGAKNPAILPVRAQAA